MEHVHIKRVYEPAAKTDGFKVLVDRLWPRGLSKSEVMVDLWMKDVAPSTKLRKSSTMTRWLLGAWCRQRLIDHTSLSPGLGEP